VLLLCVFFFSSRRRHTRFSRDWSSDVCSSDLRGEEDFAGFRRFQAGDSPRHVAWKAYARSGELYSKQFAGADTSSQWLDYDEIPATDVERRLSVLARWIVDADRTGRDYGLRLPGTEFPPAHGDAHRHRCLEALALFEAPEPRP